MGCSALHKLFNLILHPLVSILILIGYSSCEKPTAITEDNFGKRDYIWSIDSVDYGNLPSLIKLESIWGNSENDLWGVAGNITDVRDCLWHYDGIKWSRATEGTPITEFTGNKVIYAVWGTSKNNVWTVGRKINNDILSAFIMHYDGIKWTDATPSNVSSLSSILYNIYGISENNIWVGGYEYALHYDGAGWHGYKVADSLSITSMTGKNNKIYLHLSSQWGKQGVYLYQFHPEDSTFNIVDSTTLSQAKFGGKIWIIGNTMYSLTNGIICTTISDAGVIDTSGWKSILTTQSYLTERFIESKYNIFTTGQFKLIYHFNGIDWQPISISIPNHTVDSQSWFWGVWADGKEVIICDCENGIMYHGR